jgi:AAA domain
MVFGWLSERVACCWQAQVVGASCLGVSHPVFSRRMFDVVIVDEASQVTEPVSLSLPPIRDLFSQAFMFCPTQTCCAVRSVWAHYGVGNGLFWLVTITNCPHWCEIGMQRQLEWTYPCLNAYVMHIHK